MYNVIIWSILMVLIMAAPVFEILTTVVGYIILAVNMILDAIFNILVDNYKVES